MTPTIHRTDDRLAHGVVKSTALRQADLLERVVPKLHGARTGQQFIDRSFTHYRGRVLSMHTHGKLTSTTRGRVELIVVEPDALANYLLLKISFDASLTHRIWAQPIRIAIDRHCLARVCQRSLGVGDVDAALRLIAPSLFAGMIGNSGLDEGATIKVTGPHGRLILIVDDEQFLVAKTWITDRRAPELTVQVVEA